MKKAVKTIALGFAGALAAGGIVAELTGGYVSKGVDSAKKIATEASDASEHREELMKLLGLKCDLYENEQSFRRIFRPENVKNNPGSAVQGVAEIMKILDAGIPVGEAIVKTSLRFNAAHRSRSNVRHDQKTSGLVWRSR